MYFPTGLRNRQKIWHRLTRPQEIARYGWRQLGKVGEQISLKNYASVADALLVSFPKSGRTWLRYVLAHYFASGFEKGSAALNLHDMFAFIPNFDLDPARGIPAFRSQVPAGKIPMVLVSHEVNWLLLPKQLPVIFMVRDPRDVLVSAYFHTTRHKSSFSGSLDSFIDDRQRGLPLIISYLNRWSRKLQGRPYHVLSYERMSADPVSEVSALLDFIGCEIDHQRLMAAIEAGQFERMRKMEVVEGLPGHEYDRKDGESLRMRKGQVGGFRSYLSSAQISRVEAICNRDLSPRAKALMIEAGVDMASRCP